MIKVGSKVKVIAKGKSSASKRYFGMVGKVTNLTPGFSCNLDIEKDLIPGGFYLTELELVTETKEKSMNKTIVLNGVEYKLTPLKGKKSKAKLKPFQNEIDTEKVKSLIENSEGKIFTVTFIKKNGEERVMNCRRGVSSKTNGGGMAYHPDDHGLITVFDMQAKDYRMVNLDTVTQLKIRGRVYTVSK